MRRLRPMGIADILDESVDLYRSNFILLVGIAAVLYVPVTLLQSYAQQPGVPSGSSAEQLLASRMGLLTVMAIWIFLVTPIVTGALTFAISDRYLERQTSIRDSYSRVLRGGVFWRLLGAIVLRMVVGFGAGVVLMIPIAILGGIAGASGEVAAILLTIVIVLAGLYAGVVIFLKLWLVEPAVVLEGLGAKGAISRSWNLMTRNVGKGFWLFLVVFVGVALISAIVVAPTQYVIGAGQRAGQPVASWVVVLDTVLNILVNVLLTPFMSIVTLLLYYDIRMRREGFDLQVLATELDAKARDFTARESPSLPQEEVRPPEETR